MNNILELLGLNNLTFEEFIWVSIGTLGQLIFLVDGLFNGYHRKNLNQV